MKRGLVQKGIQEIELESWREFYDLVATDFIDSGAFVYRGQADAGWKTYSSLDRWETDHQGWQLQENGVTHPFECPPVSRDVHLRAFRQAIRSLAPFALQKEDDALTWALAQHHGLKTPLLDWSYSPFVALYFAFEDKYLPEGHRHSEPERRGVLALSTSSIAYGADRSTDKRIFPRVYSPSGPVSQRLLAQAGIFVQMPEKIDLESCIEQHFADQTEATNAHAQAVLKKIVVPNSDRRECLKMLNKMNINRLTLFPDLDGAARYINDLWELDFDSSLGYFEDADYMALNRVNREVTKDTKGKEK
jgi:hypothetical protein